MDAAEIKRCRLIVDSNCDLPYEIISSLGVDILNFSYIIEDEEFIDDFWQSRTPESFYNLIRKGAISRTSAYPLGKFLQHFEQCAQEGTPTVYLSFPLALSGSYNMAVMAADQVREKYPDFELYVVDTCSASVGYGHLVLQAVRMRDRGLTAQELVDWASEAKNFIHGYFTLDSLDCLARGGRIPAAAAQVSGKLDIKPMLTYDTTGALGMSGISRGRKRALKSLVDRFKSEFNGDCSLPVLIASADADKDAHYLADLIRKEKEFNQVHIIFCSVGPVIGSHVGPGMIALSFWGSDRRASSSIADKIADRVRRQRDV